MKILAMSDIHCEWQKDEGVSFVAETHEILERNKVDALVIAGDLASFPILRTVLNAILDLGIHLIFVPGNHEYYHGTREEVNELLLELTLKYQNFYWLRSGIILKLNEKRIIGDTLWFKDDPLNVLHQNTISDFTLINTYTRWRHNKTPRIPFKKWVYEENTKAVKFLTRNAKFADVVITHHAPTHKSTPEIYKGSTLTRFYVCDMSEVILDSAPKPTLWIHGHMHDSSDYVVGETRIICNPFGYAIAHALNKEYISELILEI